MSALDALDPQQREAASILRGPVAILAGAGTGKTRAITHRIAHGVDTGAYTPSRLLALTFTTKAAGELRGRLRALGVGGVSARTFHSAALSQLNYFWPTVAGDVAPKIIDNKVRLLAHAADQVGLEPSTPTLRDVAGEIEWRKVTMRSIDAYARLERRVGALGADALAALMRAYEDLKDQRRQLDFEDVLLACAGMLEGEPKVAAAVREQYRHFTVDEFQDVSPLQNRLLELWLGERRNLCVVGDASQTVYSFTGADSRFLLDFERDHPGAKVVCLVRNYRSDRAIVDVANALMRDRPGALDLVAAEDGPAGPVPTVSAHDDQSAEADAVAAAVAGQLAEGASPDAIAVLYRSHALSAPIQQALAARGVATSVLGGARFFDLPEVRQAVLALRGAAVAPSTVGAGECRGGRGPHRDRARRDAEPRPHGRAAGGRGRPARRVGGAPGDRPSRGGVAGGHDHARLRRRAARQGEGSARAGAADRDARDDPRREGPRMAARPPRRLLGGAAADLVRHDDGADRRGEAPRLRRHHARGALAVDHVGPRHGPHGAAALPLPHGDRRPPHRPGRLVRRCAAPRRALTPGHAALGLPAPGGSVAAG